MIGSNDLSKYLDIIMRSVITLIISLSLLIPLSGQGEWEIVNEGFVCTPKSVDFINNETGWIAGEEGVFLTTNGSKNWVQMNDDFDFHVIDFYSESIGWAIIFDCWMGYYGEGIMKTSDGGRNWLLQKNVKGSINGLCVVTDSIAYTIGDSIYKTADGGSNWGNITPSMYSDFGSASFINADTGIVIGNGGIIFRTFDEGESWEKIETPDFSKIYNVQFINDSSAYFLARKGNDLNQYICETTDLFSNWTILSGTKLPVHSCHFYENDVIVGLSEEYEGTSAKHIRMIKSYDGGVSWAYLDSFIPLNYDFNSNISNLTHFIGNTGYYFGGELRVVVMDR